ncbi:MAG: hypothetical protein ACR2PW_04595 [Gammaproteobacteria bacterium]
MTPKWADAMGIGSNDMKPGWLKEELDAMTDISPELEQSARTLCKAWLEHMETPADQVPGLVEILWLQWVKFARPCISAALSNPSEEALMAGCDAGKHKPAPYNQFKFGLAGFLGHICGGGE